MACDVFGPEEAIADLARDIEAERARDPGFPLAFAVSDIGPMLEIDHRQVLWSHDVLSAISRRNPGVAITLADIGGDDENDDVTHVAVFLYSKGRRRLAKSFSFDSADRVKMKRLEAMLFRLEQRWRCKYATANRIVPQPRGRLSGGQPSSEQFDPRVRVTGRTVGKRDRDLGAPREWQRKPSHCAGSS